MQLGAEGLLVAMHAGSGPMWTYARSMTDGSSNQHPEPVVVAMYPDRGEAEVTKAHLVSVGIEAFIVDGVEGGAWPVEGVSVAVLVQAHDAEVARQLLEPDDTI